MKGEREVMVWLAGLISTDGCVFKRKGTHGWRYQVSSVEKDWKEQMQKILKEIKITSRMTEKNIFLHKPKRITQLFIKYNCEKYFNPRKWIKILEADEYYKNYALDREKGNLYRCYECKRYLEKDQFHKNKTDMYGITSRCKECISRYNKERYRKSKERGDVNE